MNKTILLISICGAIIFSTIALIVTFISNNNSYVNSTERGDIIKQKETALIIGRALLEEHFPDTFLNKEETLDAEENDGIWKVYNVVKREGDTEDGKTWFISGGEVYVEFRRDTGEVTKIGVND